MHPLHQLPTSMDDDSETQVFIHPGLTQGALITRDFTGLSEV